MGMGQTQHHSIPYGVKLIGEVGFPVHLPFPSVLKCLCGPKRGMTTTVYTSVVGLMADVAQPWTPDPLL